MPPLPLQRIPVQTGANCGLFAILAGVRRLGCSPGEEAALFAALNRLEKADPRTFIGEVLSIELLLDLIRGVSGDGAPRLAARAIPFATPMALSALIRDASQSGAALLIPFARPQSYDAYYRLLGRQASGQATEEEVAAAWQAKEREADFRAVDAHWALINRVDETSGRVVLADSFEDVWGVGHGYEADFSVEKLSAANLALDGCFDWSNFLDERGRAWGMQDMQGLAYAPSTPRNKNPERLEEILRNGREELLDLAGRLILIEMMR
ncbi:MAG: hypothetical protein DWI57_05770 [Chloroflexi bacterium]|nr:MAG: hypothetical protein DWI57_05770 [Chloroflexota bacterium]